MSIQRYSFLEYETSEENGEYVRYSDHEAELHLLLSTLADIRAALGVGEKPMLSDIPKIVREIREQADRDEKAACKAMKERDAVAARAEKIRKALVDAKRERDELQEALYGMLERHGCAEDCCRDARAVLAKIGGKG